MGNLFFLLNGSFQKDPHSPTEEISAVQWERGEKFVSDNSLLVMG